MKVYYDPKYDLMEICLEEDIPAYDDAVSEDVYIHRAIADSRVCGATIFNYKTHPQRVAGLYLHFADVMAQVRKDYATAIEVLRIFKESEIWYNETLQAMNATGKKAKVIYIPTNKIGKKCKNGNI